MFTAVHNLLLYSIGVRARAPISTHIFGVWTQIDAQIGGCSTFAIRCLIYEIRRLSDSNHQQAMH